jgi:hypothetical protein
LLRRVPWAPARYARAAPCLGVAEDLPLSGQILTDFVLPLDEFLRREVEAFKGKVERKDAASHGSNNPYFSPLRP